MIRPTLTLLALAALAVAARADLESFQGLYVGNYDVNGDSSTNEGFFGIGGDSGRTRANPYTVSGVTYSGVDRQGNSQTLSIGGSAWTEASYGQVHLYGQGTVTNPYFSTANAPAVYLDPTDTDLNHHRYSPDGSPDLIGLHANGGWTDNYTYTGLSGDHYTVNYLFRLDGTASGDTQAQIHFGFNSASSPNSGYYSSDIITTATPQGTIYTTPDFNVEWGVPVSVSLDIFAGLTTHLSQDAEGGVISGEADYADTLSLVGVVVKDPSGNVVTDYSVQTDHGGYVNPVPEPASFAALGLGALAVLRRQRARKV